MLFNSYEFIFCFLPLVLWGAYGLGRLQQPVLVVGWLTLASLFFYGWWNPTYLPLILVSMAFNYAVGEYLIRKNLLGRPPKWILGIGICGNLALLGYFKYANFFVDNVNVLFGSSLQLELIVLPIAISFFTFQQIAYLIDAYQGKVQASQFLHYCLFVTFFPQLIAGPIVHHSEIFPQFLKGRLNRIRTRNLAIGGTWFILGLFKKVVLADGVAQYATPIFEAAEQGITLSFAEAWMGSLAYTFQLYFDFSGYSDMAIGLGRMFGIRLPINFHSPYKACSMIEFWRRWHMTLSRFFREYVYFPLGGNRKGTFRQYGNLLFTMLLVGFWHGAGWTFVVWGVLHGILLTVNHAWHNFRKRIGLVGVAKPLGLVGRTAAHLLTFACIVAGWTIFRASSLHSGMSMWQSMAGLNGISLPSSIGDHFPGMEIWLIEHGAHVQGMFPHSLVVWKEAVMWLIGLMFVVWISPNTQEIMRRYYPACENSMLQASNLGDGKLLAMLQWRPSTRWAVVTGLIGTTAILSLAKVSEFLYFQF